MVAASIHNTGDLVIQTLNADILAIVPASDSREFIPDAANAAFIVQAVNSHDALVTACMSMETLSGSGAKYWDVLTQVRAALKLAGA
jgi:hypothetical protein